MNEFQNDATIVCERLSAAWVSTERRVAVLAEQVSGLQEQRRTLIQEHVQRLLPGFSGRAWSGLQAECPGFANDAVVMDAFDTYRKRFFLFSPPGADSAMSTLRARLAHYIDQEQRFDVAEIDRQIREVVDARERAEQQLREVARAMRVFSVMKKVRTAPPEVRSALRTMAQRRSSAPVQRVLSNSGRSYTATSSSSSYTNESGDDLLLYLWTDIPTSARTWMLSALSSHDERQPRLDLGGWHVDEPAAPASELHASAADIAPALECVAAELVDAGDAIATDDRLGAFS